jgi:polar amino acid transport system substrate-binding protein
MCILAALLASAPVVAKDPLKVGITTTGIPFTYIDINTQQPTGAMVDVAYAIASYLGASPEFEVMQYAALIPALRSGKIQLISASMYATDQRRQVVSFSTPVYAFGEAMFIAMDDQGEYQLEDLKGETVGAQVGTTFAEQLRQKGLFREVKFYESLVDVMRDVKLGRIRAGFGDLPIVRFQTLQNPKLGVRIVDSYVPMSVGEVALAVSKEDPELLRQVNEAIAEMRASGELQAIFTKYGL